MITNFLERRPALGIFASFSGFGASVLSALKIISIIAGAGGAVLGLVAGYYTLRIKRAHWQRMQSFYDRANNADYR